jgi:hypothetical protein
MRAQVLIAVAAAVLMGGASSFGGDVTMDPCEGSGGVGQQRIYFRVRDVTAHHKRVTACEGRSGPIEQTAWMTMFAVTDPDGHERSSSPKQTRRFTPSIPGDRSPANAWPLSCGRA